MPEKWRNKTTSSQVKLKRTTNQTTLKDLFQKTNSSTTSIGKELGSQLEHIEQVAPSFQLTDPHPPSLSSRPPKPSRLYPIFTRDSSILEGSQDTVINVDDAEVIDITDTPSDTESPSLSMRHPSPRSGLCEANSRSSPPSVVHIDCGVASFPQVSTHESALLHRTSKEEKGKRTMGLGDVVPLPSLCSQHVRGMQHPYACGQTPLRRSVLPTHTPCPSYEGTLDFLGKCRELDNAPLTVLDRICCKSLTLRQCEEYLDSLCRDHMESHPAFARMSGHREKTSFDQAEMWTRRFRPRRANEVLGNERHALYLRDWLRALELHSQGSKPEEGESKRNTARGKRERRTGKVTRGGAKRPRVVRAVSKRRGNKKRRVGSEDDLDDFVVYTDEDEEPTDGPLTDSEDEIAFCRRTLSRLQGHDGDPIESNEGETKIEHRGVRMQASVRTEFSGQLTNTLLIAGPCGCGKTAAVYACAEELGWEVFEVYPGIGRRNGASLDELVGDVGKNHIVPTVRRGARTKGEKGGGEGLRGYVKQRKTGGFAGWEEGGREGEAMREEGDDGWRDGARGGEMDAVKVTGGDDGGSDGSVPSVGQSVVLLEEVDILFKEDGGFWAGVVEFIRSSQRPVVMTCNDAGLVPVGDLPLQNVLVFEPCPSTVAARYLQCVSLTEGWLVPHEDLMVLYESTRSIDGLEVSEGESCRVAEGEALPDLRRSITQLQMLCAGGRHGSGSEKGRREEAEGHVRRSAGAISDETRVRVWREMNRASEVMSHVDAEMWGEKKRERVTVESEWVARKVLEEEEEEEEEERGRGEGTVVVTMAEEAIERARGGHEGCTGPMRDTINPAADWQGFRARVEEYQTRMVDALEDIVSRPHQTSVFLDYVPWLSEMARVDVQAQVRAGNRRPRRTTWNSSRAHAGVIVGMSEAQRAAWRGVGFDRSI